MKMKTRFFMSTKYLFIFLSFTCLVLLYAEEALASGGPSGYDYRMKLDKTEYKAGETVKIIVDAAHYDEPVDSISIRIVDATNDVLGKNIIYKETKKPDSTRTEFSFRIPEFQLPWTPYRYMVILDTPYGGDRQFFFSKGGASKIMLSDLQIKNPVVMQAEELEFSAKIVDGTGNPIPHVRVLVVGDVPYQSCPAEISGRADVHSDVSPSISYQSDYALSGIIKGKAKINDMAMPGKYQLKIFANGDAPGYALAEQAFEIEILETDKPRPLPYGLFAPIQYDFGSSFMTEQPINITARTTYNGCGPALPNLPVKAEIKKYDTKAGKWLGTIATKETESDENGYFNVYFDPIGKKAGQYSVSFTASYLGKESTAGIMGDQHNVKDYTLHAEGDDFTVRVDGWYSIPLDLEFDQAEKKITLDADTSDTYKRLVITIPSALLDGDFVILENGVQRTDIEHQKHNSSTTFDFRANLDSTKIEIIGTSAVPEFGTIAVLILTVLILSVVLFTRFSRLNP